MIVGDDKNKFELKFSGLLVIRFYVIGGVLKWNELVRHSVIIFGPNKRNQFQVEEWTFVKFSFLSPHLNLILAPINLKSSS